MHVYDSLQVFLVESEVTHFFHRNLFYVDAITEVDKKSFCNVVGGSLNDPVSGLDYRGRTIF